MIKQLPAKKWISTPIIITTLGLIPSLWTGANQKTLASSLDLEIWQKSGDVLIDSVGNKGNLSTNSLFQDDAQLGQNDEDFNFSGNPATFIGFGGLEEFLDVDAQELDIEGFAFEGSAIKTELTVNLGDILKFDWQFLTNETAEIPGEGFRLFRDYAFLLAEGEIKKLADYEQSQNSSNLFDSETERETKEYPFTTQGTQTIGFGVIDVDDFLISSALLVENVRILRAVPPEEGGPQIIPDGNPLKTIVIITAITLGLRVNNILTNKKT